MLEFKTEAEVVEHYRAVRRRTNAWKPFVALMHEPVAEPEEPPWRDWPPETPPPPRPPLIPDGAALVRVVIRLVATRYGVTPADVIGQSRMARLVRPRQAAIFIVLRIAAERRHVPRASGASNPFSLPQLGKKFGGRDHTTILHADRKMTALYGQDTAFRDMVAAVMADVRGTS